MHTDKETAAHLRSLALEYRGSQLRYQRVTLTGHYLTDDAAIIAHQNGPQNRAARRMWKARRRLNAAIRDRGAVVLIAECKIHIALTVEELDEVDEHLFGGHQIIDLDAEDAAAAEAARQAAKAPSRLQKIAQDMAETIGEEEVRDRLLLLGAYARA
jgi:hypothetical protein